MPLCILKNEEITPQNDSRAHVIPSALGGRLKPFGVLTKDGNGLLGEKVDLPLVEAFQPFMSLLNGSRDRGKNQPVQMTDPNGRVYKVEFGEPLKLVNPEYHEEETAEGLSIHIGARNMKDLRNLLGRVKAKHPDFDIDEAVRHAVVTRTWPDGMLRGQFQIGPRSVFPALFASASIFAAHHGYNPHPDLRSYIAGLDPDAPVMPPDTFYFFTSPSWISAPGEVTHIVGLIASVERRRMLVYFELFNAVAVGVLLPYAGDEDALKTYAVDLLTGSEVPVSIDGPALAQLTWQETHRLGDAELYRIIGERLRRVVGVAQRRAYHAEIDTLMRQAFGAAGDKPLTPTGLLDGIVKLCDWLLEQWQRPRFPTTVMEEQLIGFDEMAAGFGKAFEGPLRSHYWELMVVFRRRLQQEISMKKTAETDP